jgi:hypothetical protein
MVPQTPIDYTGLGHSQRSKQGSLETEEAHFLTNRGRRDWFSSIEGSVPESQNHITKTGNEV